MSFVINVIPVGEGIWSNIIGSSCCCDCKSIRDDFTDAELKDLTPETLVMKTGKEEGIISKIT
jgi:hypothetical protein